MTFIYGISTSQVYVNLCVVAFRTKDLVFFLRTFQNLKLSSGSAFFLNSDLNTWTIGPFPHVHNVLLKFTEKALFHLSLCTITSLLDYVLKTFYEEIGN